MTLLPSSRIFLSTVLFSTLTFCARGEEPARVEQVVSLVPAEYRHVLIQWLSSAEEKRGEWIKAIADAKPAEREAIAFLLANMPEPDIKSLTPGFILSNVQLAHAARTQTPWAAAVPNEIFLNDVLPYASLNERREDWRTDFTKRFSPLVKDCKTAGEAALLLNDKIFKELKVQYHATKRPKPDQSPSESIQAGYASCTGLSIMLVDACRSVGIPARITGTPMWSNNAGNHTWVEIWDGQWRFIGAAESSPFNKTWFAEMAAKADGSKPEHRIYSSSFRQTKLPFMMDWLPGSKAYSAVDVTGYYVARQKLSALWSGLAVDAVNVREGDVLIARGNNIPADFELAADRDYVVSMTQVGGNLIEKRVHLTKAADLTVRLDLDTPAATATAAPDAKVTFDLDGDWAKMKSIVPRHYVAKRASAPITIDGNPDKPVWADAPWTTNFGDIEGDRKPAPRFRTRAKLLWDDDNLYILAELEEPHVWGTITKKNEVIFQDNDFEVFLSANWSNHHYYEYEMNALNTIWELTLDKPYRNNGTVHSPANLTGLKSAVHVNGTLNNPADTDKSWCVEIAMPWKELGPHAGGRPGPPKDGEQWRANFSRVEWLADIIDGKYRKIPKEMRAEDNWVWSPQGLVEMHRPERWGFVQFSSSAETAEYKPDPTLAARETLMTVYHRQFNFHTQFGKYANSAAELGLGCQNPEALSTIEIAPAGHGYIATTRLAGADGKVRVLHVQDDSKVWED